MGHLRYWKFGWPSSSTQANTQYTIHTMHNAHDAHITHKIHIIQKCKQFTLCTQCTHYTWHTQHITHITLQNIWSGWWSFAHSSYVLTENDGRAVSNFFPIKLLSGNMGPMTAMLALMLVALIWGIFFFFCSQVRVVELSSNEWEKFSLFAIAQINV